MPPNFKRKFYIQRRTFERSCGPAFPINSIIRHFSLQFEKERNKILNAPGRSWTIVDEVLSVEHRQPVSPAEEASEVDKRQAK